MTGRGRQILILVSWVFLLILQAQAAEQPVLVFPQIAAGPDIRLEINLANLGNQVATGYIWFREDDGDSMDLLVEGNQAAKVSFALPPGGARKFSASSDLTKVGYAVVMSSSTSVVVGSLIYTINGQYDVSVPHSPATTRAHVVVDKSKQFDSAVAFLNTGSEQTTLRLSLRCEQGTEIANDTLELPPGRKKAGFVESLLAGVPGQLTGVLNITADKPFHLLGLRQRLPNMTLASLTAGTGSFSEGGSQIMYLIDSGVDLTSRGFSQEQLAGKTVYELTGVSKATRSQKVALRNTNLAKAVTLKCYFLNDKGREFLSFLIVLKCGQTLIFDPFDFEIPGTDDRTSEFIFGSSADTQPVGGPRWTAAGFSSGKFLFSAGAVGAPANGSDTAYFLYPSVIAPTGECGVTPVNTGSGGGFSTTDLHVCNALPMAFDYLTADCPEPAEQRNEVIQADAQWMALTAFSRTMSPAVGISLVCQAPAVPDDPAKVFAAFTALNEQSSRADDGWPTALVIYNGAETYKLSK